MEFQKFMEVFDIGDDPDEPNVNHIDVRPDMSRDEVVQETLKMIIDDLIFWDSYWKPLFWAQRCNIFQGI